MIVAQQKALDEAPFLAAEAGVLGLADLVERLAETERINSIAERKWAAIGQPV